MANNKASVLKRARERARDERNARKREERSRRAAAETDGSGPKVATRDELGGYGLDKSSSGDPFDGQRGE